MTKETVKITVEAYIQYWTNVEEEVEIEVEVPMGANADDIEAAVQDLLDDSPEKHIDADDEIADVGVMSVSYDEDDLIPEDQREQIEYEREVALAFQHNLNTLRNLKIHLDTIDLEYDQAVSLLRARAMELLKEDDGKMATASQVDDLMAAL